MEERRAKNMAAIRQGLRAIGSFLKKFYNKHTIGRIALTVAAAVLLVYVFCSIPAWTLKSRETERLSSRQPVEGSSIDREAGKVQVAESGGRQLWLDTVSMVLEIRDETGGTLYSSAVKGGAGSEMALLSLAYLGEDNNLYEWNSYDNCTLLSSYELYQIENGVRIDLDLNEGESNRFYEYLPKKMGVETYENVFRGGIQGLIEDGTLDEATGQRYLTTLSLVYKKSLTEECYAVTYTGNPPVSATNQMIEITRLVGYDTDMLLADADAFGFTVTFTEPAQFDLSVELTLDGNGDLLAHVPTGSIVSHNDYYTPQSLSLLPNLGAATVDEYEEGYILVPDGSGALMAFNSYIANVTDYKRPYYDNDFYSDYYYMPEYGEELYMPLYGMLYGSMDSARKGFLAIAEEGARTAVLNVKLASASADSAKYNKAYNSFEIAQYKRVKINGEYSAAGGTYLVNTGMQDLDLTVRYQFYGQGVTYFDMARGYQAYLAERKNMPVEYGDGAARLYVEAVGGVNITSRFVGIPYSKAYSMTTCEELLDMMERLEGVEYLLQYDGAFNGGWNNELNRGADLAGQNGGRSDMKKLLARAGEQGIPLYLQVALSQVWDKGNGFRASSHAVRGYDNEEVSISRYQPVLGVLYNSLSDGVIHDSRYILAPRYLGAVTDAFLKEAGQYGSLAVSDLAGMYYADYRYEGYISGEQGDKVLEESLKKLSGEKDLALVNPHIDKIGYGSVAVDISRESSDYATFAVTIPFKQLVMNGLIDYTTEDVNLSSKNPAYFVLQAAELGAYPKFLVTWKNVDALKNSDYSYLYSAQFSVLEEKLKGVYEQCAAIRSQIGTDEITGHGVVQRGVYRTDYATGKSVYVNYNLYDVELPDGTGLPAEGYLIREEK